MKTGNVQGKAGLGTRKPGLWFQMGDSVFLRPWARLLAVLSLTFHFCITKGLN